MSQWAKQFSSTSELKQKNLDKELAALLDKRKALEAMIKSGAQGMGYHAVKQLKNELMAVMKREKELKGEGVK